MIVSRTTCVTKVYSTAWCAARTAGFTGDARKKEAHVARRKSLESNIFFWMVSFFDSDSLLSHPSSKVDQRQWLC